MHPRVKSVMGVLPSQDVAVTDDWNSTVVSNLRNEIVICGAGVPLYRCSACVDSTELVMSYYGVPLYRCSACVDSTELVMS